MGWASRPHKKYDLDAEQLNYRYYKEESLSSIGSGTVESTIKRIGRASQTIGSAVEY